MTQEEIEEHNSSSPPPSQDGNSDPAPAGERPRPRSVRSWRSLSNFSRSRTRSRTGSRSGSPDDTVLRQVFSAGFHDDHSIYRNEHDLESDEESPDEQQRAGVDHPATLEQSDSKDTDIEHEGKEEIESQDHASLHDGDDRAGETAELEKAPTIARRPTNKSARSQKPRDPNMVSWEGPDDPENPKNWALKRKWIATLVVSCFTFISPVASSMVAPALPQMAKDLGINNTVESQMTLSIFCELQSRTTLR